MGFTTTKNDGTFGSRTMSKSISEPVRPPSFGIKKQRSTADGTRSLLQLSKCGQYPMLCNISTIQTTEH